MPLKKTVTITSQEMRNFLAKKRELRGSIEAEEAFEAYIAGQKNKKYESMKVATQEDMNQAAIQCTEQKNKLVDVRMNYLQNHRSVIFRRVRRTMMIMITCCRNFPAMS